jgi:phage-related protein
MPNNETLGGSFYIDVTQLKAGLAQANRLIRESESEFKAAAAGMDDWSESQEGLEARIKHLNNACDLQRKKVDALQSEYDRLIADGMDPTSAAAVKLRTDINKEKEALAKTEKEIDKQTKALEEVGDESEEAATATKKAGDAAEDAGDGFTVAKGAVAGFIANGLTALVGAAKDAISNIAGLAESTREYRTIMASLDESSKLAGYTAEETAETYEHLYGVLGDAQAVSTTTANLQAMGQEQGKLQTLTDGVIGAWAKYGDSIPIDGLAEAVNHTMQLGEVQGTLADVIEWGGGTVEAFNEKLATCTSDTERADMIMKLFAEQGLTEAGAAWQENNKSIVDANKAQSENERVTAAWGKKVEPITTKVQNGFNSILEKILELIGDVDLEAFGNDIDEAFSTFTDDIIPEVKKGLTWIIENKDLIVAGIVAMGTAFAAFKVVTLIQSVTSALQGMSVAQAALNAVMALNPIGIVIAAVAGLVAAFVVLWKKCDAFREFWVNLWEGIKKAFNVVVDFVKKNWDTMLLALVNPLAGIFKYCYEHFEGFRKFVDNIVAKVSQFFSKMWSGLTNGAKNAWAGVKSTFSAVASFFGDIFGKAWAGVKKVFSTGGKIFDGIKEGIVSSFKTVVNGIITGINKVVRLPFQGLNNILNRISGLTIAGIKPFSWLWWRAPIPQLPMLEKGGVVRKATTAVIGENGAEAVVPLEKNTGWIKKLAAEIAAQQPQGVVVNQTNNYSQAHSRVELYKTKQATAAAVRLALNGA